MNHAKGEAVLPQPGQDHLTTALQRLSGVGAMT